MKREVWVERIIPAFIFFALWLDGQLLPLAMIPIFYVIMIEKKDLCWLGFSKNGLGRSLLLGLLIAGLLITVYYPIFLFYHPYMIEKEAIDIYMVFSDVFHYPLYEEIAYRSFLLSQFANSSESPISTRNLSINLAQSLLFLSIHRHHFGLPLVLVPVVLLAFLNGIMFLRTRNIYGCFISHSALNGSALIIRYLHV